MTDPRPIRREETHDPLWNVYRLKDGTWVALGMPFNHRILIIVSRMTLAAALLSEDSLTCDGREVTLAIRLNWDRSLPLSSVETLEVRIGGATIHRDQIKFELNGQRRALTELRSLWNEEWFILDRARLRFVSPVALALGLRTEVTVKLGSRIPYILIGANACGQSAGELAHRRGGTVWTDVAGVEMGG
jgi:hypothetical protein